MSESLVTLLALAYPIYKTINALDPGCKDIDADKHWMTYWGIYIVSLLFNFTIGRTLMVLFPTVYLISRLIFYIYLMAPQSKGALVIYYAVVCPYMDNNKGQI